MKSSSLMIPAGRIEQRIFFLREIKLMLSTDLAELYGVAVEFLNQALKRNREKSLTDFIDQVDRSKRFGRRRNRTFRASVLKS